MWTIWHYLQCTWTLGLVSGIVSLWFTCDVWWCKSFHWFYLIWFVHTVHSFIHSFIPFLHSFTHSVTHLFIDLSDWFEWLSDRLAGCWLAMTPRPVNTRKPSCRWQTRATLAKSLHGLRNSSGVVSCIARLPIDTCLWCPITSYIVTVSVKCVALEILAF